MVELCLISDCEQVVEEDFREQPSDINKHRLLKKIFEEQSDTDSSKPGSAPKDLDKLVSIFEPLLEVLQV